MRTLNLFLLFFFLFALNSYSLPECEGDDTTKWNNCYGTMTYPYASKYVGEFKDDKSHGKGTYTLANGDKYVGEYKNDKKHGHGSFSYSNGDKYVGQWKDGKRHGKGTATFANGDNYIAEFKDGKEHGKGIFNRPKKGQKLYGEWKNGEFVVDELKLIKKK